MELARGVLLALESIRDAGDPGHTDRSNQVQRIMRAAIISIITKEKLAIQVGSRWSLTEAGEQELKASADADSSEDT